MVDRWNPKGRDENLDVSPEHPHVLSNFAEMLKQGLLPLLEKMRLGMQESRSVGNDKDDDFMGE